MVSNEKYTLSLGGELVKDFKRKNEYCDIAPGNSGIYIALHKGRGPQQFKVYMENIDRRKIPSSTSTIARHAACSVIHARVCPLANRLAIENGSATPTRNENDG